MSQKELTGVFFRKKEVVNNRSSYEGSCMIDGKEYFMDAWVKESASGEKFFSLSFKLKKKQNIVVSPDEFDDLPF